MTVFKTFLKVVKAYRIPIILYTTILIALGSINISANDQTDQFVASKPAIYIINHDENKGITKDFCEYMKEHAEIVSLKNEQDALDDALFYRDVHYIIEIPEGFRQDFLNQKHPKITYRSSDTYEASLAEMLAKRYLKVAKMYQSEDMDETEWMEHIHTTLGKETKIKITSKLDTAGITKGKFFYNFMNYSLLAGCVYVICLVLSSFREEKVKNRTMISSVDYRKYNFQLYASNGLFALVLWALYVLISFFLVGKSMTTMHGLMFIANSFIFMLCALSIAFLIANITTNKGAVNGIVNVIALGSSFLCGAFVPMEMLPDFVLKIAHILPSYWYIKSNEIICSLETITIDQLKPVFMNMGIILLFIVGFFIASNVLVNKNRKIKA